MRTEQIIPTQVQGLIDVINSQDLVLAEVPLDTLIIDGVEHEQILRVKDVNIALSVEYLKVNPKRILINKITRAEIEAIRGVNSDGTIYKLLEYNLIAESGKSDAPGRPMTFSTTSQFLKMFGISNLNDLPELPKYKLDENRQIVIDEIIEENSEAPIPSEEENN